MMLKTWPCRSSFRLSLPTLIMALSICTGLVACGSGGGGDNLSPVGPPPPPPPSTSHRQFAYVASTGDNKIYTYSVNQDGTLTPNGSVLAGTYPEQIAFHPSHLFAYVVNSISHDISMYRVNPETGALSPLEVLGTPLPPLLTLKSSTSIAVERTGRFAYTADGGGASVSVLRIDPTTGALSLIATVPVNVQSLTTETFSVAVDPTGSTLYATAGKPVPLPPLPPNEDGNGIQAFSIDPATGTLTSLGTKPAPAISVHIAVHPTKPFIYLASGIDHMVTTYNTSTPPGPLTHIETRDTAGAATRAVAVDHTGTFAYVANVGSNDVSVFGINQTTGALTPIGLPTPLPPLGGAREGGEGARWVTAHPSKPFLYVTYFTNPPPHTDPNHVPAHVAAFRINLDGSLTHIGDTPTGDGSLGITVISVP